MFGVGYSRCSVHEGYLDLKQYVFKNCWRHRDFVAKAGVVESGCRTNIGLVVDFVDVYRIFDKY